ncbi:MAG: ComEC/Rec2 family competence protein [Pseudohongiellaceae bacterium]
MAHAVVTLRPPDARSWLLAWSAGILVATPIPEPAVGLLASLAGAGAAFAVGRIRRTPAAALLLAVLAGMSWHMLWAESQLRAQLPVVLEGQDVTVSGRISSLPAASGPAQRFEFTVSTGPAALVGRRLLLADYGEQPLAGGQHWHWTVRLKRPHGQANPGGFDNEARLFQRRIVARGYVRPGPRARLTVEEGLSLTGVRQRFKTLLDALPGSPRQRAVLLALTLGDRSELSTAQWDSFSRTGTNHLFVISGLHVGLVSLGCYLLSGWLWRCLCLPVTRLPRQQVAALVAIAGALAYALLAGFTLPTQRAVVMVVVFMSGRLTRRSVSLTARFCLALALVLLGNPLAVAGAGFWLSFGAVAGLMLFLPGRDFSSPFPDKGVRYTLKRIGRPQLVVFVALLAPLLAWTGQVSLLAPLVNIVAIPLVGLLIVPLALGAALLAPLFPVAASYGLGLADWLLTGLLFALDRLAALTPWSQVEIFPSGLPATVCAAAACLLLLVPGRISWRWLCVPLFLPLFLPSSLPVSLPISLPFSVPVSLPLFSPLPSSTASRPPPGSLQVQVLDVGQGLAVLLRTHRHAMLYDTGPGLGEDYDLATTQVIPVLGRQGIRRLDRLLLSHLDSDHAGGLESVLEALPVAEVMAPRSLAGVAVPVSICAAGQSWTWDGVIFRILWPDPAPAPDPGPAPDLQMPPGPTVLPTGNNGSCVLQVSAGGQRVLLPGDIEAAVERTLVLRHGEALRSSLLLAAHHGSDTSSGFAWLKTVAPRVSVFSAGYRNGFGHPAAAVQSRHGLLGIATRNTAASGWLRFELHPGQALAPPLQFRQSVRRYWRRSEID